jgi:putative hydrolase of the HAD superfamily
MPSAASPPLDGVVLALDVDGVLLDSTRTGRGSWHTALTQRFGVDAAALVPVFFERSWPEIVVGRRALEPALSEAIAELAWDMTVEQLINCWFEADFVVDAEVLEAALKWAADGARLVLVTNQEHRRAAFLQERLAPRLPLGGLAYSAGIGMVKADPGFFPLACDRLGIDRDDRAVVFVDDTAANVAAARRHGWTGVQFTRGEDWQHQVGAALSAAPPAGGPGPVHR